jgi:phage gpG-like protein
MKVAVKFSIRQTSLNGLAPYLKSEIEPARQSAQNAMADIFHQITLSNFGMQGMDRPSEWADLSPAYAKKVHREAATLNVSGALHSAIKVAYAEDASTVSVSSDDIPYALAHQFGNPKGNLPARPYFPIDANGQVTQYTREQVLDIAKIQFAQELR